MSYARIPVEVSEAAQGAMGVTLQKVLMAANQRRQRWYLAGWENHQYGYSVNHNFQYQTLPDDAFFRAKEPLTAEAVRVFGPYLYQQNPHITVSTDSQDPILQAANQTLDVYLNQSLHEYDAFSNARRCIDQSVVWGRAVRWTTRHPTKPHVIVSLYRDVRNFFDDPEANAPEERRIIIEKRVRPVDEVVAEHPTYEAKIRAKQREQMQNRVGDTIEYYEAHAIVGLHHFKDGEAIATAQRGEGMDPIDRPLLYLFTREGELLCCSEWEVPYYIDGEWPCSLLDYFDHEGDIWPEAPLTAGAGHQRAYNWLSTLTMGRMRNCMRMLFSINKTAGEGLGDTAESQILMGADIEALMIAVTGQRDLKDFIQERVPSMEWLSQSLEYQNAIQQRYREITGLYAILYTGVGDTQARSATDSELRARNSQSRLQDMKDRIISWERLCDRKQVQAARYLLTTDEVARLTGPKLAQAWGFLASPQATLDYAAQLEGMGAPPDIAMQLAQQEFQGAIDWNRWADETDVQLEPDSLQRRDLTQQLAMYKEFNNQVVPTQMASADPAEKALGYFTAAEYIRIAGGDPELRRRYMALANAFVDSGAAGPVLPAVPSATPSPQTP